MDESDITSLCETINKNVIEANKVNVDKGEQYCLSLSIGISTMPCSNENEFDQLLKKADEDMYSNKASKPHRGRSRT